MGAVVGRADIMEAFNPKAPSERRITHTGTWNANPLLCAAGVAACKLYLNGEPQKRARDMAAYLREKGNRALRKRNINGRLYSRTVIHLYFGPIDFEPPDDTIPPTKDVKKILNPATAAIRDRLGLHLLQRGIATMSGRFFVMSAAHSQDDIDQAMDAFDDSLDAMIAEGTLGEELVMR